MSRLSTAGPSRGRPVPAWRGSPTAPAAAGRSGQAPGVRSFGRCVQRVERCLGYDFEVARMPQRIRRLVDPSPAQLLSQVFDESRVPCGPYFRSSGMSGCGLLRGTVMGGEPVSADQHSVGAAADGVGVRLLTPAQAAGLLQVWESWLRRRAAERRVPCCLWGSICGSRRRMLRRSWPLVPVRPVVRVHAGLGRGVDRSLGLPGGSRGFGSPDGWV